MFEGWLTLAAWAEATERATIGLMVGANTFREPGARRQDGDHPRPHQRRAGGPRHRRRLVRDASTGPSASSSAARRRAPALARRGAPHHARHAPRRATVGAGRYYTRRRGPQRSAAVQARLPILVGGGGEKMTLGSLPATRDACNLGGGFENVKRKDEILRRHCEAVGRDEPRSSGPSASAPCIIRDDPRRGAARLRGDVRAQRQRRAVGGPAGRDGRPGGRAAAALPRDRVPALDRSASPRRHDAESLERLITEVKPAARGAQ